MEWNGQNGYYAQKWSFYQEIWPMIVLATYISESIYTFLTLLCYYASHMKVKNTHFIPSVQHTRPSNWRQFFRFIVWLSGILTRLDTISMHSTVRYIILLFCTALICTVLYYCIDISSSKIDPIGKILYDIEKYYCVNYYISVSKENKRF